MGPENSRGGGGQRGYVGKVQFAWTRSRSDKQYMLKSSFFDNLRPPSGLHAAPSHEKKVLSVLRG